MGVFRSPPYPRDEAGKDSPTHDLTIYFDNSVLTPTQTARNLGFGAQLSTPQHSARMMSAKSAALPSSPPGITVSQPLTMSTRELSIINIYQCLQTEGTAAPSYSQLIGLDTVTSLEQSPELTLHAEHTESDSLCYAKC
ncbi:unnamed protein product [Pleuronectes platessa]|uniref:Uncharacterized protein n=1 Tax=Pleuronectes platessa TaxID=8262 RepID=A0A9N7TWX9_PLEPL|nr:unnamed protein product [Pleuronectes platessa]